MDKSVATASLTKNQALALTERIRETAEGLWTLLLQARDGRAWEILGYDSMESYAETEFGIGRSQAYRLIGQGEVLAAIESARPIPPAARHEPGSPARATPVVSGREAEAIRSSAGALTEIKRKVAHGVDPAIAVKEVLGATGAPAKPASPNPAKPLLEAMTSTPTDAARWPVGTLAAFDDWWAKVRATALPTRVESERTRHVDTRPSVANGAGPSLSPTRSLERPQVTPIPKRH
jgi:hypothetical protein